MDRSLIPHLGLEAELLTVVIPQLEVEHYTDAIKDAFLYLSKVMRMASGADDDGVRLISKALGGEKPLVRLNLLGSTSEEDEQKGWAELLRGLYIGIRNPRSHDGWTDSEDWCIRVLIMVDAAAKRISRALPAFDVERTMKRILDPHFVETAEYAEHLVSGIPAHELPGMYSRAFSELTSASAPKLRYSLKALIGAMDEEQRVNAGMILSSRLQMESDMNKIAMVFRTMPPALWTVLERSVQDRLENMIVENMAVGHHDRFNPFRDQGGFGTWATVFGRYFRNKERLVKVILNRLGQTWYSQNYIGKWFLPSLPTLILDQSDIEGCCDSLAYAVINNDSFVIMEELGRAAKYYPQIWKDYLLEKLKARLTSKYAEWFASTETEIRGR